MAVRLQPTSPHGMSISGICRDESSDGLKINMENSVTGWHCRLANSTSNVKKRPQIYARHRLCGHNGRLLCSLPRTGRNFDHCSRIHSITVFLDKQLKKFGYTQVNAQYFDTLRFELPEHVSAQQIRTIALSKEVNLSITRTET